MARPTKVVELGLEDVIVDARDAGLSLEEIRERCNEELAARHAADLLERGKTGITAQDLQTVPPSISKPSVERYLRTLGRESVAPAHAPQAAGRAVRVSIDFAESLTELHAKARRWLDEADGAVTPMRGVLWDPYTQEPLPTQEARDRHRELLDDLADVLDTLPADQARRVQEWVAPVNVMVPDWRARTSVAKELRETLDLFATVMQRIHDAQAVAEFQRVIFDAIREADPDTAHKILERLRGLRAARQASMLGLDDD